MGWTSVIQGRRQLSIVEEFSGTRELDSRQGTARDLRLDPINRSLPPSRLFILYSISNANVAGLAISLFALPSCPLLFNFPLFFFFLKTLAWVSSSLYQTLQRWDIVHNLVVYLYLLLLSLFLATTSSCLSSLDTNYYLFPSHL